MSSQPGQPVAGGKKDKFNWGGLVFALLLIGGLIAGGLWWSGIFDKKVETKGLNYLETKMKAAATQPTDDKYFKEISLNRQNKYNSCNLCRRKQKNFIWCLWC